jgi:hypothetical protein
MACAASPKTSNFLESEIQRRIVGTVISGHFIVLSIMPIILRSLVENIKTTVQHTKGRFKTYLGSHFWKHRLISPRRSAECHVAGSVLSTCDSTILKDFPEAIVYVITWQPAPILIQVNMIRVLEPQDKILTRCLGLAFREARQPGNQLSSSRHQRLPCMPQIHYAAASRFPRQECIYVPTTLCLLRCQQARRDFF